MNPETYTAAIKAKLQSSAIVTSFEIVKETTTNDSGYLRVRCQLINQDFLETAEFFRIQNNQCQPESYRYQWMDATHQILRQRWDNVKHFPNLPNFPHHVHIGSEDNVKPSQACNTLEILEYLEILLART